MLPADEGERGGDGGAPEHEVQQHLAGVALRQRRARAEHGHRHQQHRRELPPGQQRYFL